jgi:hypothetical protein
MKTTTLHFQQSESSFRLAKVSIALSLGTLAILFLLHVLSPEFAPSWRMVSEYAYGQHQWALTLFFLCWGISSCCLATVLWTVVTTNLAKVGVVLLFISGLGEASAAIFDVEHSLHGLSGLLGVPTLPVAALLISYHLKSKAPFRANKHSLLLSAHATWVSLVLMIVSMIILITGFQNAGVPVGEGNKPPVSLPEGVIAVAGYANRLFILVYNLWLINVARIFVKPG